MAIVRFIKEKKTHFTIQIWINYDRTIAIHILRIVSKIIWKICCKWHPFVSMFLIHNFRDTNFVKMELKAWFPISSLHSLFIILLDYLLHWSHLYLESLSWLVFSSMPATTLHTTNCATVVPIICSVSYSKKLKI